ncbi:MAG: hypothetical protein ACJAV7_001765 [Flavobacteriales bacterium]|jgi:hypothetical protein
MPKMKVLSTLLLIFFSTSFFQAQDCDSFEIEALGWNQFCQKSIYVVVLEVIGDE